MNRFLKIFCLLIVALFLLVSGVDATLDHLARSPGQNSFIWYNEKGEAVLAYDGDAALAQHFIRPSHPAAPALFHRS